MFGKSKIEAMLTSMGLPAKDKITEFSGTLISLSFDVFGCVQGCLVPKTDKDGKTQDGQWFDINRLEFESSAYRKMDCADFNKIYKDFSPPKQEKPLSKSSTAGMGCSNLKPTY